MSPSERELRRHLAELSEAVTDHLVALDALMQLPATVERGKRVANIANLLDIENDRVRYFALGVDYRTDRKERAALRGESTGATGRAEG